MSEYEFTQDWFHWAPEVWKQLIPHLPKGHAFLEIGSFEGRSTVWIIENMMEDTLFIDCIDTWEGGEEHTEEQMSGVEARFDANTELAMRKFADENGARRWVTKFKGTSTSMLAQLLDEGRGYSFIYIDGSHVAKDVMTDACMAWPLLKEGGILVFDDYLWGEPTTILHKPKIAIDYFTTLFAEELEFLHIGYQLIVRKK